MAVTRERLEGGGAAVLGKSLPSLATTSAASTGHTTLFTLSAVLSLRLEPPAFREE